MNIIVVPYNSDYYYIRPDTTLEKESKDYYCPDSISHISAAPCIYIKIIKAGKTVNNKFASRYFGLYGFGVFLYGENLICKNPLSFSVASSCDYTSILPTKMYNFSTIEEYSFEFIINGENYSTFYANDFFVKFVHEQISKISSMISLRIGDFIAFELSEKIPVQKDSTLLGKKNQDLLFDFKIC
ncbi:MAG: hypothetical protein M0R23_05670 [Bacteroidales bacterium]|nr:hypothetical protein [Bacteroidales bacterium]